MLFKQLKNERGIAMVLALSMVALLSILAIWLMLGSGKALRITTAATRYECGFNLAEGALQLSSHYLEGASPVPYHANIMDSTLPIPIEDDDALPDEPMGKGFMIPRIHYVDHNSNPPPGWMANPQGYYRFFSMYYQPRGKGRIPLSSAKGDATTTVATIVWKVSKE